MTPETMPDYWITRGEAVRLWLAETVADILRVPLYLDWYRYYAKPRTTLRKSESVGCPSVLNSPLPITPETAISSTGSSVSDKPCQNESMS